MKRRRPAALVVMTVVALSAAACGGGTAAGPFIITQTTNTPPSSATNSGGGPPAGSQTQTGSAPGTGTSTGSTSPSTPSGSNTTSSGSAPTNPADPNAEADGFVPTKLKPGQKPPQFIAVSFDGAGWHEKWEYYSAIAQKVPFHFTANLTGLYLLDDAHRDYYRGPGHERGASSLGTFNSPAEVKQEILDLNKAYADGNEIATHFMGHFCSDNPPGADVWTTAQWNSDLDQFFDVWANYQAVDQIPGMPTLNVPSSEVTGERTPCLQGKAEQLFPALVAHHMDYDQSFTHRGISWPKQSPQYKIWSMGMAEFPMHGITPGYGRNHFQITMDYNFWYSQEFDASTGEMKDVSPTQSSKDAAQVQATYQDMLNGAMAGSHAPLLLGNHFNEWNNNAYTEALGNFLLANCGKANVHCVPYRDVVDWMKMQSPSVLARLQNEPPVLGPPGSTNQ